MSNNIKIFISAFYESNKREFWLLIVFNIILGAIVNLYDFNGMAKTGIIVLMAMKNLSFLRSASVMPSVSSDFDRYSWKYFQGLPLSKEELIISLMISNIFVMFPGVVWLMAFFIQIASLFADSPDKVNYVLQLKIFLCLLPVLFIISSMSLVNLITFPRKQYSKNEPKALFLHKVKTVVYGALGFLYFMLGCVYFNELTGFDIGLYFGNFLRFVTKQSTWWIFPGLIFVAFANYFYALRTWQDEKKSYSKIDWNPKKDFSIIGVCLVLFWAPLNAMDVFTPEEFANGKIVKAIHEKDLNKVKALIADGHDINEVNQFGFSPILTAALKGNLEAFKILEDKGAKLTGSVIVRKYRMYPGMTILGAAVQSGSSSLVRHLLKKGFDINEKNSYNQWSPLHYAAKSCRPYLMDMLINSKADLNARDKDGKTPLHLATEKGCFANVALLLDAGANPSILDNKNKSPSIYASEKGSSRKDEELAFYLEKRSRKPASK